MSEKRILEQQNTANDIIAELYALRSLYTHNKQLEASMGFIEGTIEEAQNVPCWVNMPAKEYDALIARTAKLEKVAEAARNYRVTVDEIPPLWDEVGPAWEKVCAALAELDNE